MGSHRLFVAVDPPESVAAELAGWARAARGRDGALRVIPPARIHLTLAFLGEQAAADVPALAAAIAAGVGEWTLDGGAAPVPLELGAPLWLPPRHPRALAVAVGDPTGRLADLRRAVAAALEAAVGWSAGGRAFRPHLTVGRGSGRRGIAGALAPTPAAAFTVDEVVLYRSFLEPEGARYEALERVPLV